jgi:meso-butanediol dehydrogenase/(S,S)-butanediol dehydrogenase/diacetyl reductase
MRRFDTKAVIVTAAGGKGTGAALVRRFLAEGASVVASDRDEVGLHDLERSLEPQDGQKLVLQPADVTSPGEIEVLVQTAVERLGRLDVLCNHAGGGRGGSVAEMTFEAWRDQMALNLDSVYLASHFAMPHLIASHGCIVNTASISGIGGDWGMAGYNAAKAGVINLTRSMAVSHAADGVRVNAVSPGAILTPDSEPMLAPVVTEYLERVPLRRFASPDDIAAAITFLASDDASYITGQVIVVDGGITADNGQFNFKKPRPPAAS